MPYSNVSLHVKIYRDNIVDTFIILVYYYSQFYGDTSLSIKKYRDDIGDVEDDMKGDVLNAMIHSSHSRKER
jgi:hypothetical protein